MTSEQLDSVVSEIIASLEAGADMASVLAPQIVPFVLIGKAFDKVIPELAKAVSRWLDGNAPTPQELQDFKNKLAVLLDPNAP